VRLTILIFLLCLAGCKTKQKSSSGSVDVDFKLKTETTVDSTATSKANTETEEEEYVETEQTTTKYVAVDSSGVTVLKPEVTSTKTSTGKRRKDKIVLDTTVELKADRKVDMDSIGKNDYKTDDVEKPTDVVGSIAGVLFPSWLKIAGLIIGLVSTAIVTRVYIKKAKAKQFSD
jgi:hypothetical protein